jgi:hypothetical protein
MNPALVGRDRPLAAVEAVVPLAPVPDLVPGVLRGRIRRQRRDPHPDAWALHATALLDGFSPYGDPPEDLPADEPDLTSRWRDFRATYERWWALAPGWQLAAIAGRFAQHPVLAHLADASQVRDEADIDSDLLGDVPSTLCRELLGARQQAETLLAGHGAALSSGGRSWPVGAALEATVDLESSGQLQLATDGRLTVDGQQLRGWQLRGQQVELSTDAGGWQAPPLVAAALIRLAGGHGQVETSVIGAREALGPALARLWEALETAASYHRSLLLVACEVTVGP